MIAPQKAWRAKHWTKQESNALAEVIHEEFGGGEPEKWDNIKDLFVAKLQERGLLSPDAQRRSGKACRLRYKTQIKNDIYWGEFEEWEDEHVKQEIQRRGRNEFAKIADSLTQRRLQLGGQGPCRRTDNMVKNRWTHVLCKQAGEGVSKKRKAGGTGRDECPQAEVVGACKRQKGESSSPLAVKQGNAIPAEQVYQLPQQQCTTELTRGWSDSGSESEEDFMMLLKVMFASDQAVPAKELQQAYGWEEAGFPACQTPSPGATGQGICVLPDSLLAREDVFAWGAPQTPVHDFPSAQSPHDSLRSDETGFNLGLQREDTTAASILTESLTQSQEAAQNLQHQEPGSPRADLSDLFFDLEDLVADF